MTTHRKQHSRQRDIASRALRKAVAVDIENLAGGADVGAREFRRIWNALTVQALTIRPGDLVIVAASRYAAREAAFALKDAPVQWRWRDGKDGADDAILEFFDIDHEARRRSQLVIASGDHAFAGLARRASSLGMSTRQVVGVGTSSRELRAACVTQTRLHL